MKNILLIVSLCIVFAFGGCKSEEDKYKDSSSVTIDIVTEQTIDDLYVLCKVWGFLRFYHPNIVKGDSNWDYELFRIIPKLLSTTSLDARNQLLGDWVKQQGTVTQQRSAPHYDNVKTYPDLDWLDGEELKGLSEELVKIKNAEKDFYPMRNSRILVDKLLEKDEAYAGLPDFPDVGYRLLTLFRYWNIVEYFFPYKYLIGRDWDEVLLEFIPQFIAVDNAADYYLLILKLLASVNDTHASIIDPVIYKYMGQRMVPIWVSFVENKAVVTHLYKDYNTIKRGDVIVAINDIPTDSIIKQHLPYTPASNYPTKLRIISRNMLRTNEKKVKITFESGGLRKTDSLDTRYMSAYEDIRDKYNNKPLVQIVDDNILYLFLGSVEGGSIPQTIDSRGVVIDLRTYPNGEKVDGYWNIHSLYPNTTECVNFTEPVLPGLFAALKGSASTNVGRDNPDYYKGLKVILVNEGTQSHGEFMAMRYRCAPNSIIIGSTTAGADGDVFHTLLPGNIKITLTGLGVYYPDGGETQRVGIVPDIEVKPTIEGVRDNRDELLEQAIKIINENI